MKVCMKEIEVVTICPFCGRANFIKVNENDYFDWSLDGVHAQDAFPYLTANEREMLISGICPDCWDNMMSSEEDDSTEEEEEEVEEN